MFSLQENFEEASFGLGFFTVFNFLSNEEIDSINQFASKQLPLKGSVYGDKDGNVPSFLRYEETTKPNQTRDSKIAWLDPKKDPAMVSLYKKIINKIIEVNQEHFKYNLTDLETLQYTIYNKGQYYKKHLDLSNELMAGNIMRKLSFSIQLSDSSDYEGGELCGYVGEKEIFAEKQKGSLTFFPSFLLHEVKPVTSGKRISLVGWVNGPRFT